MGLIVDVLGLLFGGGRNVLRETAQVFGENAEAGAERARQAQAQAMRQFGAEFAVPRAAGEQVELGLGAAHLRGRLGHLPFTSRREQPFQRGFTWLYQQHVTQAHEGCDFDFLQGTQATPEPVIF